MNNDNILKQKIHEFIKYIYLITQKFPKHEQYGLTSQLRRAAVSIMLNYLEGYARFKPKVKLNFYITSFASAKESKYIIYLLLELKYTNQAEYDKVINLLEEISAMFYSTIQKLEKATNNS